MFAGEISLIILDGDFYNFFIFISLSLSLFPLKVRQMPIQQAFMFMFYIVSMNIYKKRPPAYLKKNSFLLQKVYSFKSIK